MVCNALDSLCSLLILQAKKPELAIDMYKARNMWDEAIRFAQVYLPSKLSDLQYDFAVFLHRLVSAVKVDTSVT